MARGVWERLVSCVKRCIKKAVGVGRLSYTELQTLIMEIEAILNNRPICQDYDDEIEDVLTPNHLLYGRRLENVNNSSNCSVEFEDAEELGRREKHISALITYFWNVWRKEYLTMLRENQKLSGRKGDTSLAVGDNVIVYDKHQPRHLWKLGRVMELIIGSGGVVRGAKIKLGNSGVIVSRPLNHVYPLEIRKSKTLFRSDTRGNEDISNVNENESNVEKMSNEKIDSNVKKQLPTKKKMFGNNKKITTAEAVAKEKFNVNVTRPKRNAGIIGEIKRREESMR